MRTTFKHFVALENGQCWSAIHATRTGAMRSHHLWTRSATARHSFVIECGSDGETLAVLADWRSDGARALGA